MSWQAGQLVGEKLRLIRSIGRGAMGSVWLAEHLGLQSEVAVKFMLASVLDDPVSVLRFQQEARAAAEIRSPHVVRVIDNGLAADGTPYLVMELLEGESLDRRIRRTGPMSLAEVVVVVTQAGKALAKAHERGIIHRDIKPPNLFLTDADGMFVKVVDFGVARFSGEEATELTVAGNMIGTPAYMSPEQLFHGKTADHRADLWSLAVCAYFALSGRRPFEGSTLGELCVAVQRADVTPVTRHRPDLPAAVDVWFEKAFAREIGARFSSSKELAQSLEKVLGVATTMSSTPSHAGVPMMYASHPGTSIPRPSAPQFRTRGFLLGALAVLIGTVGLVVWHLASGAGSRASELPAAAASSVGVADEGEATGALVPPAPHPSASTNSEPPVIDVDVLGTGGGPPQDPSSRPASSSEHPRSPPSALVPAPLAPRRELDDTRTRNAGKTLGI
ncbi:MAG: serine/threonine protein kinase [Myxococcales bacterium]|nr:serine/threonine protein kinase [Myxococcales bacterium]